MFSTAYNLWTFTWFVHFELLLRLKGTEKIHTERFSKLPSSIYSILFDYDIFFIGGYSSKCARQILPPQKFCTDNLVIFKVIMQGKLFQRCTHLLYCSALSLSRNVRQVWHGIHLSHKKSMKYSGHRKLLCELLKLSKFNAFSLPGY